MTDFTMTTDAEGIATIIWDMPGRSMNVLTMEGAAELDTLVGEALSDEAVKGIIITSGKDSFSGGMDLNVLAAMKDKGGAEGVFEAIMSLHHLLRRVERAGMDPTTRKGAKPVACVLPGTTLGIGLEIALATHRIFAADNPKAKIGLPEIQVGLFPGAGGTTRLLRKLGAMAAAPLLLEGRLNAPQAAKGLGIIDEVADDPMASAREWVLQASESDLVKPWDAPRYRMPGGAPYDPAGFMTFLAAPALVMGRTKSAYPAARALLSAAYEGALVDFDTALRIEARWFTSVLMNPSSSAMIRTLFVNKQALERGANRPSQPDQSVRSLGVIGAGMMGAGIAHVAARAGIDVALIDSTQAASEAGKARIAALMDKDIQRRRLTEEAKAEVLDRITPDTDYAALSGCDLVIEAVFEDPAIKAEVMQKVGAVMAKDAILASNTSTLPITGLADASPERDRFIGIHFFSPVERMALVEIIRGPATGDQAVAKALDFVRQLRKTPIVVNDGRFFYANRCIIPYINEGIRMIGEGVAPALIEHAAQMLGMPVGPLQLIDETSIELGVRIAEATRAAMGDAYPDGDVDKVLFAMADAGRLGRKARAGFYDYDDKGKRTGLWAGLGESWPPAATQPDLEEVQQRLILVQVLEAVRAFEAGVLTDIREGDVGAVLGWGFAPWSGGPFSWLDIIGAAKATQIADDLTRQHGARFTPSELLREMADRGEGFYARFASPGNAA